MKTKIALALALVVAIAALIYGYVKMNREQVADKKADQPISAASRVARSPRGETVVTLDQATQQLIGLQTAPLAAATLPQEMKAYGRALDPAPLVALVNDIASDRAALVASSKEYQRQQDLYAGGRNTSAKALETAEAAMQHDQIALATAEARLVAAWGKAVAEKPSLPAFVQSFARLERVLVRLDLPAGESLPGTPVGARLALPGTNPSIEANFLGRAATTDPQTQGEGFLFVATNAPAALTPGLSVAGFVQLPGEPLRGVVVPDAAIVRSSERSWVYAQTGDTTFARQEVVLDHPAASGWFVTNALAPGTRVVVTGAQMLLSEERKSQIKLED
jgi:hypothetical protein